MKSLTKEERTGAVWLAVVSLLVCGGALIAGHLKRPKASEELVKSVILLSDSIAAEESSEGVVKREKKGSASEKKEKKKKKKGDGSKQKKPSQPKTPRAPSRDFLSDPL